MKTCATVPNRPTAISAGQCCGTGVTQSGAAKASDSGIATMLAWKISALPVSAPASFLVDRWTPANSAAAESAISAEGGISAY